MKKFYNKDVIDYYDQTEVHYKMFWGLDQNMGIHYGVWEKGTKSLSDSVLNTNRILMEMGEIKPTDNVLDAGCGVGGSSIFLAQQVGCKCIGITLSKKQVATAQAYALKNEVSSLVDFKQMDYTITNFEDNQFDIVWAIESMQTAHNKELFFREISRILKPGGKLLIADCFKSKDIKIDKDSDLKTMLNGWAISDITTFEEMKTIAMDNQLQLSKSRNVTSEIFPSAKRIYYAGIAGMFGTKIYNLFKNATPFSKTHYKTGLAQYKALKKQLWEYHLIALTRE